MGLNAEQIDRWLLSFYLYVHHNANRDKHLKPILYTFAALFVLLVFTVLLKISALPK